MKKETMAISRYPKHWNRDGVEVVYQVWYHQWEHWDGERKRIHERVYPTHKAETFCNLYNAEQFILSVKKYPLAHSWYQPKLGDRLSIRSYKRYFIEFACSQSNRLGSLENLNVTKIQRNTEKGVEYYVTMFFTSYKDGCEWIKNHYKEYHITNVGIFKNYLLRLIKKWAKEAGSNVKN